MSRRRAVITGIGIITCLGLDKESCFEALLAGRSGIAPITGFDASAHTTRFAGEVKSFDPGGFMPRAKARRLDRFAQLGLGAALPAWEDSGLKLEELDHDRVGCICGSGIGGLGTMEEQHAVLTARGPGRVSPFLIPKLMINALSGEISMALGLKGPNWVTSSACASAAHALGTSLLAIRSGAADIIVSGGSEATITPLGMAGFCSLRALSTRNDDPERASRPFDRDRDGFVMGEGAAALVLEELEHARQRGARIYAELAGFGATADAHHITAPAAEAEGAQRSMRAAMQDGGVNPEEVDYINAHGTSTPVNDINESIAIRKVFGPHADKLAVSSTKSMIGHLLGASAGVEAAVCALSIHRGQVHQTQNHEVPGEGCDLDYVKEGPREMKLGAVLSNSLGFGGHNATLLLKRCES